MEGHSTILLFGITAAILNFGSRWGKLCETESSNQPETLCFDCFRVKMGLIFKFDPNLPSKRYFYIKTVNLPHLWVGGANLVKWELLLHLKTYFVLYFVLKCVNYQHLTPKNHYTLFSTLYGLIFTKSSLPHLSQIQYGRRNSEKEYISIKFINLRPCI